MNSYKGNNQAFKNNKGNRGQADCQSKGLAMTFNLADLFESVVDTVPEREAIVTGTRRLSYQELDQRTNSLAHALENMGVKPGDKIGLQLRNCNEYIEAMIAAFKIRAIAININFNYVEDELHYLYDNADLVALIVQQEFATAAAHVAAELPPLKHILWVKDNSGQPDCPEQWHEYEACLASAPNTRDFAARSGDDQYIVYTGGTTGRPKGVIWRHEDIFFAAMGGGDPDRSKGPISKPEELPGRIFEFEVAALPTPPFIHAAAQWLAMNQLFSGAKIVIPEGVHFDASTTLETLSKEKVMLVVIVGDAMATPIAREVEENPDKYDLSSLFVIASGGALFSPVVKKKLLKLLPGRIVLDGLGSSETGAMGNKVMMEGDGNDAEPRFTVNDSITVLDDKFKPIKAGSGIVGLLAKKGHLPLGYYKAAKKTAQTFIEVDGVRWALPGDMATVEEDGTILLMGRESTCINTGGEKVFPEEVEAALKEHPLIQDALVIGVADERFGQQVVAVYETQHGDTIDTQELRDFCHQQLAKYKLPRKAFAVKKVERTAAGKADYAWARKLAEQRLQDEALTT